MARQRQSFKKVKVGRDLTTHNVTHNVTHGVPVPAVLLGFGILLTAFVFLSMFFVEEALAYRAPLALAGTTTGMATAYGAAARLSASQPFRVGVPLAVGASVMGAAYLREPAQPVAVQPSFAFTAEPRPAPVVPSNPTNGVIIHRADAGTIPVFRNIGDGGLRLRTAPVVPARSE